MPTLTVLPLSPQPQSFRIQLGESTYRLVFMWRDADDLGWVLDVYDDADNPIACGLPLVTGSDLLGQLATLGIPGPMFVLTDGEPDAPPTFNNLGITAHVYWVAP